MAEWLNAALSKSVVRLIGVPGVRISPPPSFRSTAILADGRVADRLGSPSGRRLGAPMFADDAELLTPCGC